VHVRTLELAGFRNYASLSFTPDPGLNALIGPNGHGKTSLLEAIHVLIAGRSFRTPRLAECVAWDGGGAQVAGELADGTQIREVRLTVAPRPGGAELRGELCPWGRVVAFSAADLALLTGGPPGRRAYLDGATAKLVPAHAETCRRYRLVLHQRARLLAQLGSRADGPRLLAPWDDQVATLGSEIVHRRLDTLAALGAEASEVLRALGGDGAVLTLDNAPAVAPGADPGETRVRLLAALEAGRAREAARGLTLAGPHRDDLGIRLGRAEARIGASRGAQRLIALTLRLAEAAVVRRRWGRSPVFVLDDLLSELDQAARGRVLDWLAGQGQALFSTTDAVADAAARGMVWEVRWAEVVATDAVGARGAA
jgi:DNA replication and repair protein RecF